MSAGDPEITDGHQRHDFVSVVDVVQAYRLALQVPEAEGQVFNVGSGRHDTVRMITGRIAALLGKEHIQSEIIGRHRVGADWHTRTGQAWYSWLLPRLAAEINLLPCFLYTPPSLGVEPKTAAPPRDPRAYADFLGAAGQLTNPHGSSLPLS
jgi:hypothetical protein